MLTDKLVNLYPITIEFKKIDVLYVLILKPKKKNLWTLLDSIEIFWAIIKSALGLDLANNQY